jgi:hypothetical protein
MTSFACATEYYYFILKPKTMKNSILKSVLSISLILLTTLAFSQSKEERDLPGFSGISLGISAHLYLSQGSPQKVVIKASEEDLAKIKMEVKDGHLKVKTHRDNSRIKDVEIWVTIPDIESLKMSGSGKIISETPLNSNELDMRVSGSGTIKIKELEGKELEAAISGSGSIYLGGTAEELDISISGSGRLKAGGLQVDECDVRISGSGGCMVDATGKLDASISGSGSVTYLSNPQVDARTSGSGKVRKGER